MHAVLINGGSITEAVQAAVGDFANRSKFGINPDGSVRLCTNCKDGCIEFNVTDDNRTLVMKLVEDVSRYEQLVAEMRSIEADIARVLSEDSNATMLARIDGSPTISRGPVAETDLANRRDALHSRIEQLSETNDALIEALYKLEEMRWLKGEAESEGSHTELQRAQLMRRTKLQQIALATPGFSDYLHMFGHITNKGKLRKRITAEELDELLAEFKDSIENSTPQPAHAADDHVDPVEGIVSDVFTDDDAIDSTASTNGLVGAPA